MKDAHVDRVREDLELMRVVLGFRAPFEQVQLWANIALAFVGVLIAALTEWTSISSVPSVHGSGAHWAYISLIIIPPILVLGMMAIVAHYRRDAAPLAWRDARRDWVIAAIAAPAYLGFVAWAAMRGASLGTTTAATLFVTGLFALLRSVTGKGMDHTTGWAASTMIAGILAPSVSYGNAGLLAGGWLLVGGLSSAAVMALHVRSTNKHVAD